MEKSTTFLIRRSIYTFLQYYHYFTATAAILALPYSLSVLVSQFFVPSSPLLPSIHNHLKAIFMAAEFPPSSDFFRVLSFKISQTISSSIFALPFTLSFFLVAKASIIHLLNHHHTPTSPPSLSSVLSLYKPLLSTFICNFFVLLSANSTAFCLLFFGFHLFNGFGFSSSPNWLIFMSAAGAVLYSVILANALIICNLALVSSGMEKSGGYSAILRACVLIKGRASTALALAVPWNLALAAIEALFHYRVVRAYHSGDFNSFSIALEVVLIAYLYSNVVVLDTVVSSMLFKSCKTGCLMDEERRDCYRIEIVAEKDGRKRENMAPISLPNKPHAVCIPYPAQGHVNPMLKVAKLLHFKGFHITFVNTEYNHKRLLKSRGPHALNGLPDFRFGTIPDGLPPPDIDATQDIPALCDSTSKHCLAPFRRLLVELKATSGVPPVTCIVADGCMSFTLEAAKELGIPSVLFWTPSASGFLAYCHYRRLIDERYTPLKDESYMTNGYLDTVIDWIPGMKNIRIRDLPSFVRTTNPDDIMLNFLATEGDRASKASAIIVNTFDELEHDVVKALSSIFPKFYTIGPLHLLLNHIPPSSPLSSMRSNLWKEEPQCLQWLDLKESKSVVYVNFGSITVMTANQMVEFAWGLANSKKPFLWIIRPDLVRGDSAILPPEFIEETKDRCFMASWCPQEEVLNHSAVAGFLTHSGWNSTVESISSGVAMVSWPFFAEQQTNCWFACNEWGIGMEIDNDVKREKVEKLVRELMEGRKGEEMRENVMEWKRKAERAACLDGPSLLNLDRLINEVLLKGHE